MRFRSHLVVSALAGIIAYPRSPRRAALIALSGVIIDIDHFVLYASRSGDADPLSAMRYDKWRKVRPRTGDTRPRYGPLRSIAHHAPLTLPLTWGLTRLFPALMPLTLGITIHLAMDTPLAMLLDGRIWLRSGGVCERCGTRRDPRHVYHIIVPSEGGSFWATANRALWCELCAKQVRKQQGFS